MTGTNDIREDLPNADQATLKMLSVLEEGDNVTQRELAQRIGVALGFANKLIKRAVNKGLLKVSEAPAKRYAYYLTPQGFAEKSRLVGEYLSSSLHFFRHARQECDKTYQLIKRDKRRSVALYGVSEFAEIAVIAAHAADVKLHMIVEEGVVENHFSGLPVVTSLKTARDLDVDALMICRSEDPQNAYFLARKFFDDEQIYAAKILQVSRKDDVDFQETSS